MLNLNFSLWPPSAPQLSGYFCDAVKLRSLQRLLSLPLCSPAQTLPPTFPFVLFDLLQLPLPSIPPSRGTGVRAGLPTVTAQPSLGDTRIPLVQSPQVCCWSKQKRAEESRPLKERVTVEQRTLIEPATVCQTFRNHYHRYFIGFILTSRMPQQLTVPARPLHPPVYLSI